MSYATAFRLYRALAARPYGGILGPFVPILPMGERTDAEPPASPKPAASRISRF
jgi:hypothetical protein